MNKTKKKNLPPWSIYTSGRKQTMKSNELIKHVVSYTDAIEENRCHGKRLGRLGDAV